jgi:glycosyltransferase involved in cell wall biosynthesis
MPASKILFIVPYPERRAPSQRFRVELFEPYLKEAGIPYTIAHFMDDATWNVLYKKGSAIKKVWGITKGYLRRLKTVFIDIHQYKYVFVHREAAPLGPPFFEWMIAKVWRKKMIFDFDDAIWIPNITAENKLATLLKSFWKIKYICKWSYKVAGGNDYLCDFARRSNPNVVRMPTCVDMERMHNQTKVHGDHKVVVGWTGSHSTLPYLNDVMEVLQELQQELNFSFMVIADKKPELPLRDWQFIPWQEDSEVSDLLKMDIGIMPLQPDEWSEGKCGFKLIQYLSLSIPAVASPAGVNKIIIENGVNGYLCNSTAEWKAALTQLINNTAQRKQFGEAGQQKMRAAYSVQAQQGNFLRLFS